MQINVFYVPRLQPLLLFLLSAMLNATKSRSLATQQTLRICCVKRMLFYRAAESNHIAVPISRLPPRPKGLGLRLKLDRHSRSRSRTCPARQHR